MLTDYHDCRLGFNITEKIHMPPHMNLIVILIRKTLQMTDGTGKLQGKMVPHSVNSEERRCWGGYEPLSPMSEATASHRPVKQMFSVLMKKYSCASRPMAKTIDTTKL